MNKTGFYMNTKITFSDFIQTLETSPTYPFSERQLEKKKLTLLFLISYYLWLEQDESFYAFQEQNIVS